MKIAEVRGIHGNGKALFILPCSKFHQGQEIAAFEIVTGRHRLEAAKMLGWDEIEAVVMEDDIRACRLWEISENLHRAELTALERDSLVAEWVELTGEVSGQNVQKPQGGRPEGGVSLAARQLPVEGKTDDAKRKNVERALKVASLSPEAQDVARSAGLDDNRSALLDAAKHQTPEAQVEYLRRRAETKLAPVIMDDFAIIQKQKAVLIKAWEAARPDATCRRYGPRQHGRMTSPGLFATSHPHGMDHHRSPGRGRLRPGGGLRFEDQAPRWRERPRAFQL